MSYRVEGGKLYVSGAAWWRMIAAALKAHAKETPISEASLKDFMRNFKNYSDAVVDAAMTSIGFRGTAEEFRPLEIYMDEA